MERCGFNLQLLCPKPVSRGRRVKAAIVKDAVKDMLLSGMSAARVGQLMKCGAARELAESLAESLKATIKAADEIRYEIEAEYYERNAARNRPLPGVIKRPRKNWQRTFTPSAKAGWDNMELARLAPDWKPEPRSKKDQSWRNDRCQAAPPTKPKSRSWEQKSNAKFAKAMKQYEE